MYHPFPASARCRLARPNRCFSVFYCTGLSHDMYFSAGHCSSLRSYLGDTLSHRPSTTLVDRSNAGISTSSTSSIHEKTHHILACAYLTFSLGTSQPGLTYHSSTSRFSFTLFDVFSWLSDFITGPPPSLAITRCLYQDGQRRPSLLPLIPAHCPHYHG